MKKIDIKLLSSNLYYVTFSRLKEIISYVTESGEKGDTSFIAIGV
jgi:hypothetical protein